MLPGAQLFAWPTTDRLESNTRDREDNLAQQLEPASNNLLKLKNHFEKYNIIFEQKRSIKSHAVVIWRSFSVFSTQYCQLWMNHLWMESFCVYLPPPPPGILPICGCDAITPGGYCILTWGWNWTFGWACGCGYGCIGTADDFCNLKKKNRFFFSSNEYQYAKTLTKKNTNFYASNPKANYFSSKFTNSGMEWSKRMFDCTMRYDFEQEISMNVKSSIFSKEFIFRTPFYASRDSMLTIVGL